MVAVIDADGHLVEDYADIAQFYTGPLKGGVNAGRLLPTDHLHGKTDTTDGGRMQGTADEWLQFLEESGLSQTVIYPSGGLSIGYARREIDELLERPDLSDEAKEAVLGGNVRRLYGLN